MFSAQALELSQSIIFGPQGLTPRSPDAAVDDRCNLKCPESLLCRKRCHSARIGFARSGKHQCARRRGRVATRTTVQHAVRGLPGFPERSALDQPAQDTTRHTRLRKHGGRSRPNGLVCCGKGAPGGRRTRCPAAAPNSKGCKRTFARDPGIGSQPAHHTGGPIPPTRRRSGAPRPSFAHGRRFNEYGAAAAALRPPSRAAQATKAREPPST